ncbi:CLUMA_CG015018, isoform A [Clunio marinus]|uniref:CLUMA_CG015018, isoform A n=1 Tax=Clunio marinus TaxID=568069 RepID=A0A1J1IQ01_9DIPT|nr:CLUMA_CG015018, isoform A [Clunio marinus]
MKSFFERSVFLSFETSDIYHRQFSLPLPENFEMKFHENQSTTVENLGSHQRYFTNLIALGVFREYYGNDQSNFISFKTYKRK